MSVEEKKISEVSSIPKQEMQEQPGLQHELTPQPLVHHLPDQTDDRIKEYQAAGKLKGKIAIITGGDSGIGRSTAALFAMEGAEGIAIDAKDTKESIEKHTNTCVLLICKDIGHEQNVIEVVNEVVNKWGRIDILVNNASEQHVCEKIEEIDSSQVEKTFRSNIFGMIYMAKHCVKHMKRGSTIINVSSVTAYHGHPVLIDYSSTKGAIVAFTRSLSLQLVQRGIRVNGVAPGPIWTPLIRASFSPEKMEKFGKEVPMKRAGQPSEVATCNVFLASNDSSYITGQFLHPNGGTVVNG
ncbi:13384_t:CDS:10 [Acaulospora morrowiae]|uniref:13384_t:CDS:1 n=1 Tax=Acaulospora morrowiae TaxID=94023 RepID=A0A9N9G9V7_9GLOM|nr:13384_t:CDS:10 [Acaulospora morrowiae]